MKNRINRTLPIIIGILISWGCYVFLMDVFLINEKVSGNPVRLAFVMLLTYVMTLIWAFRFQYFANPY